MSWPFFAAFLSVSYQGKQKQKAQKKSRSKGRREKKNPRRK
jgi:hypothetical protein